jgi:hypothetical protein
VFVLYLTESLVHLPLLNVLLGVPLELLGLTSAVALGYKYTQEGGEPLDDLAALTVRAQDNRGGLRGDATRRVAGGRSHECGRGSAELADVNMKQRQLRTPSPDQTVRRT